MAKFNVVERTTQRVIKTDVWSKTAAIDFADELHAATGLEHEVHKIGVIHISKAVKEADIDF